METLLCSKHSFHIFAEHQGWLLLFDKMTDNKSEVGYLLQTGSSIFTVFIDGLFDHMNDNTNASLSVNSKEDDDDES
jgi:uncharacterized membrane protein required for colicin V production